MRMLRVRGSYWYNNSQTHIRIRNEYFLFQELAPLCDYKLALIVYCHKCLEMDLAKELNKKTSDT